MSLHWHLFCNSLQIGIVVMYKVLSLLLLFFAALAGQAYAFRPGLMPGQLNLTLTPEEIVEEQVRVLKLGLIDDVILYIIPRDPADHVSFHLKGEPRFLTVSKHLIQSELDRLIQIAKEQNEAPLHDAPYVYLLTSYHTGNPNVDYLIVGNDPQKIDQFLDHALILKSPFVYKALQQWLDRELARLDEIKTHFLEQSRSFAWLKNHLARLTGLDMTKHFNRRISFLSFIDHLKSITWDEEMDQILTAIYGPPPWPEAARADLLLAISENFKQLPWADFDSALLIDRLIYHAQLVSDDYNVLNTPSFQIRQILFDRFFVTFLKQISWKLPTPTSMDVTTSVKEIVHNKLSEWGFVLNKGLYSLKSSFYVGTSQSKILRKAVSLLEMRSLGSPLFSTSLMTFGDQYPRLPLQSIELVHRFSDMILNPPNLKDTTIDQTLSELHMSLPEAFVLLGGFASNRFFNFIYLAPVMVDIGNLDSAGLLSLAGARLHFQIQALDLIKLEQQYRQQEKTFFSLPPSIVTTKKVLKGYHFWTEALLGYLLAKKGYSIEEISNAAAIIGETYRKLLTPLYLSYTFFKGDGFHIREVIAENYFSSELHRQGALLGATVAYEEN